jgi:hypothetical protein
MMDLAVPDAQWAKPELANGEYLDWQRACGWMATWCAPAPSPSRACPHPRPHPLPRPPRSPVLILFLVSMTTFGGREASVRVVPLLVANQARPPAPPAPPPPPRRADARKIGPPSPRHMRPAAPHRSCSSRGSLRPSVRRRRAGGGTASPSRPGRTSSPHRPWCARTAARLPRSANAKIHQ